VNLWVRVAPAVFVVVWSTGFIGARYGLPYAAPLTLLALRMALAAVVLAALFAILRAPKLTVRQQFSRSAVIGILLHAVYLGGAFVAIDLGLPLSVTALIVCLQPLLVAVLAGPFLGEKVRLRQWLGFGLGFAGAAVVLAPGIGNGSMSIAAAGAAVAALAGSTFATLLQKRWGAGIPPLSGTLVQYIAAAGVLFVVAALTEPLTVEWSLSFAAVLAYMVLVLSVAAILLMFWLLRRGSASGFSSLYFLVPPVTLLEAALLFGERLPATALAGFAVATLGVALVRAPRHVAETS